VCHREQVDAFGPALRALVLVLKALLREARLNERATGGLGSYCLLNLVMAHLLAEGVSAAQPTDLGGLLLSFLRRFGADFDYVRQAVSVRQVLLRTQRSCS
jgi:non-canonical poly(A) RNA polymerase PAPD5/7